MLSKTVNLCKCGKIDHINNTVWQEKCDFGKCRKIVIYKSVWCTAYSLLTKKGSKIILFM